ncbi:MAG: aldose epimerase family protein [Beijerinckiaceae bacterium]
MDMHIAKVIGQFEGKSVEEVTLKSASGASARIMTWGAVVRDLMVPHKGRPQRVVLGFDGFEPYPQHSPHFGAIAGRFANRINRGTFRLDGKKVQLSLNQNDPPGPGGTPKHHLHGGKAGFGKRLWTIARLTADSVTLVLVSPDGDEGYPGTLTATCVYTLLDPGTLRVELSATTDKPTVVNLAQHSYFNLDGSADIKDHHLTLDAAFRTPTDKDLIPTGEIVAVARTPYDYRKAKPMAVIKDGERVRFDGNFIRSAQGFGRCARVESKLNGLTLECWTDQPAVQFYDGAKINVQPKGLDGAAYGAFAGFCLEPQVYPDSPNRPHFTNAELWPGEVYSQLTEYRFS